jgi:DNA modification methylase
MPTLNWIGKQAVVNHHQDVPFRLLRDVPARASGSPGDGNLVIHGDNLDALKALLPYYEGEVQCVFIDPPYNTGVDDRGDDGTRSGWIYNDKVDSPEIREWLGRVVGAEAEDLSRHDKWLCMMYPRLVLLRRLLKETGVIFVSIDDIELPSLRLVLDEIFGATNHIGTIIWKNATDNNPTRIVTEHEYVVCYARNKDKVQEVWKSETIAIKGKLLELGRDFVARYRDPAERQVAYTKWFREHKGELWPFEDYKFIDDGGIYTGSRSVHNPGKEGYRFDVIHPNGKVCVPPMNGYRFPPDTYAELNSQGRILFGKDETKLIELKVYAAEYRAKLSSLFELDGRVGTNEIKAIFPDDKRPFDFPKPTELIEELLSYTTRGDDLILDSFAGSGTTGHAVLKLNRADGQNRRFILIEMKKAIAEKITSERVRRVAEGYVNAKGERVEGLGGGFRYCELGATLCDEWGGIRDSVTFAELARHVYFSETGEPLPRDRVPTTPFLGEHRGVGVYLLYNGILGDKSAQGGNVLTRKILAGLPAFRGPRVIYCAGCLLGADRLREARVTIRQTPLEVKGT